MISCDRVSAPWPLNSVSFLQEEDQSESRIDIDLTASGNILKKLGSGEIGDVYTFPDSSKYRKYVLKIPKDCTWQGKSPYLSAEVGFTKCTNKLIHALGENSNVGQIETIVGRGSSCMPSSTDECHTVDVLLKTRVFGNTYDNIRDTSENEGTAGDALRTFFQTLANDEIQRSSYINDLKLSNVMYGTTVADTDHKIYLIDVNCFPIASADTPSKTYSTAWSGISNQYNWRRVFGDFGKLFAVQQAEVTRLVEERQRLLEEQRREQAERIIANLKIDYHGTEVQLTLTDTPSTIMEKLTAAGYSGSVEDSNSEFYFYVRATDQSPKYQWYDFYFPEGTIPLTLTKYAALTGDAPTLEDFSKYTLHNSHSRMLGDPRSKLSLRFSPMSEEKNLRMDAISSWQEWRVDYLKQNEAKP